MRKVEKRENILEKRERRRSTKKNQGIRKGRVFKGARDRSELHCNSFKNQEV